MSSQRHAVCPDMSVFCELGSLRIHISAMCLKIFRASTRGSQLQSIDSWLAAWAGHELGGSALHQCRWEDVVWAPRCRDCVMGCCGVWLFFIHPLFLVNSHLGHSRAWIPACLRTAALLHRCFPSNLYTTTQGASVKLRRASSQLCTLFIWSV